MKDIIHDPCDWVLLNILEGGMLTQADAARFLGFHVDSVHLAVRQKKLSVWYWQGRGYLSFTEVLEYGLMSKNCTCKCPSDKSVAGARMVAETRFSGLQKKVKYD